VPLPASRDVRGRGLRIGVLRGTAAAPVAAVVQAGVDAAAGAAVALGHQVEEADFPRPEDVAPCLSPIFGVGLGGLTRDVRRHPDRYHPYLADLARLLPEPSGAELEEALRLREDLRARMMACFQRHDLLICPQAAVPAFPIGPSVDDVDVDGRKVDLITALTYCFLVNATGNPSLALPVGVAGGLPIGVQLVGGMWEEATIFAAARPLLEALGGVPRPPKLS
jgi:Asp-tRNA(Asn)/Glu-tRNA(Gln) amidotransferase A subunit family amidase